MDNGVIWRLVIVAICSYLIGNFNSAITISKLKGGDVRKMGSGNPGTMNMSRNYGLKIGLLVFFLDVLKGVIPAFIAGIWFSHLSSVSPLSQPIHILARLCAGFFAVIGHVFPAFYKFKGGKGIATTLGALFVSEWWFVWVAGFFAIVYIFVTKMGAMGSFIATAPTAIFTSIKLYFNYYQPLVNCGGTIVYYVWCNIFIIGFIALTWFAHRENIKRLLYGEEHDTAWLQMIKDKKLKKKYLKENVGK